MLTDTELVLYKPEAAIAVTELVMASPVLIYSLLDNAKSKR